MRNPYWNGEFDISGEATNAGDVFARIFEPCFDGETTALREVGRRNVQEEMDAFVPYTDISFMLNRLKVGDTSVLCQATPYYGDFSAMPTNPADVLNLVRNAEAAFSALSPSERAAFGNDWRRWFTASLQADNKPVSVVDNSNFDTPVTNPEVTE